MTVAILILAAGLSRRFGAADKRLALISGVPLVRRVTERVLESKARPVIVVIGTNDSDVEKALSGLDIQIVVNGAHREGMGTSVAAGTQQMPDGTSGVMVLPADMPKISPRLINHLIDEFQRAGKESIVMPKNSAGKQRNPVLWPTGLFDELKQLDGELGAKPLLKVHSRRIRSVIWSDDETFLDIDTLEDLRAHVDREEL